jgi:hypothetical protein
MITDPIISNQKIQEKISGFSNREQVYKYIINHKLVSPKSIFGPVSDDELNEDSINDIQHTKSLPDSAFVNLQ